MKPGPVCQICAHAARHEIEAALLQSRSTTAIVAAHRVSRDALGRHRRKCIPETLARSRYAAQLNSGDFLIHEARRLYDEALAALARAKAGGSDLQVLRAIREARPALELLAKLDRQVKAQPTVNIHKAPDFQEFQHILLTALDAHPEAVKQAAVADRLVLTKADLAADGGAGAGMAALRARLRALNPAAPIVESVMGEVEPARLLVAAGVAPVAGGLRRGAPARNGVQGGKRPGRPRRAIWPPARSPRRHPARTARRARRAAIA